MLLLGASESNDPADLALSEGERLRSRSQDFLSVLVRARLGVELAAGRGPGGYRAEKLSIFAAEGRGLLDIRLGVNSEAANRGGSKRHVREPWAGWCRKSGGGVSSCGFGN